VTKALQVDSADLYENLMKPTVEVRQDFIPQVYHFKKHVNNNVIPVTGRSGPWSCVTSRLPHFLDNRLTDGGEVVGRP
jgi:hypothetical protein